MRAKDELLDFEGTGMSIMEHSHREKSYEKVHFEAKALMKELMGVPDTHDILFLQGGASMLFATVPMNFLNGKVGDYVVTGVWSKKAFDEAKRVGEARIAGTGEVNKTFVHIPKQSELDLKSDAAYVHVTSNNTIYGTQWWTPYPETGTVPMIADMSSDILSRPTDVSKFALIYAGAQKNLGPSGVVVVIIDKAFMATGSQKIPVIFQFRTHAENDSLYNTPPTFGIYIMRNVLQWVKDNGGAEGMAKRNREKADELYKAIDDSNGFYRSPVEKEARSEMNIVFRLPTEDLEKKLNAEAQAAGMVGLKGHRSVGGLRASCYNAVSIDGVKKLTALMREFQKKNG